LYDQYVPSRLAITAFTKGCFCRSDHDRQTGDNKTAPRMYSAKSDFLLNTPYVPIIIQTIWPADESECCRMLPQAMAHVRSSAYQSYLLLSYIIVIQISKRRDILCIKLL
jgi:hypothetical protein